MAAEVESEPNRPKRWKAFLTYAHNDNIEYVKNFHKIFTRELARLQIGDPDEFYLDVRQLDKAGDVKRYLEVHASRADFLIIFVGKHYPSRPFCLHEWIAFRKQFRDLNEVRDRLFIIEIDKDVVETLRKAVIKGQKRVSTARAQDLGACFREAFWTDDGRITSTTPDGKLNEVFEQKAEHVAEVFAQKFRSLRKDIARHSKRSRGGSRSHSLSSQSPRQGAAADSWQPRGRRRISNVTRRATKYLTGRDSVLWDLHDKLTKGLVVLTGPPGVGKTEIALKYIESHIDELDIVWWVDCQEKATVLIKYAALGEQLGARRTKNTNELASQVSKALAERTRWLLVFDDATQMEDLPPTLPQGNHSRILITSINPNWEHPLDVPLLNKDASVAFLRKRTGEADDKAAGDLADELGYLPLALEQAAAYMGESALTVTGYLEKFVTCRKGLWDKEEGRRLGKVKDILQLRTNGDAQPVPKDGGKTVRTTFTMAMEQLRRTEPKALALLNVCAFLAPEVVPSKLLTENAKALPPELGAPDNDGLWLIELRRALRSYSLLEITEDQGLKFHRLLQAAVRDTSLGRWRQRWIEAAVMLLNASFTATSVGTKELLAHALAASRHAEKYASDTESEVQGVGPLLMAAGRYLKDQVQRDQATECFRQALAIYKKSRGSEHPDVAMCLHDLGWALHDQRNWADAERCFKEALAIHYRCEVRNLKGLGFTMKDQKGKLGEAREYFEGALAISKDALAFSKSPRDSELVTGCLSDLGWSLRQRSQDVEGDFAKAAACFEQALEIDQERDPNHADVARDLVDLGYVLKDQVPPKLAEAQKRFEQALKIREVASGLEHRDVAQVLDGLGYVLKDQGDDILKDGGELSKAENYFERAEECFRRMLKIDLKALGPEHPAVERDRKGLGFVLKSRGELARRNGVLSEAYKFYRLASNELKLIFPADHEQVLSIQNELRLVQNELRPAPKEASARPRSQPRKGTKLE